jgi:V/A-type H+-transporting ATPase subunit E
MQMQQKVQELADTLYREGVQKGEKEAEELVRKAKEQAQKALVEARAEAESIVERARGEAAELKRNTESEIRLSSQQALSVVKQKIVEAVMAPAVDAAVVKALSDSALVAELVKQIVSAWDSSSSRPPTLELLLPEEKRAELEKAMEAEAGSVLKRGVEVTFAKSIKGGLAVGEKGGYRISLTDEDFVEFFRQYLRPRMRAFLFGEEG